MLLFCSISLAAENRPIKPLGKDGKPLNLDFETGTLKDWTATGNAFDGQPIRGDTVFPRRNDMHSNHQGQFWIGGFEVKGDDGVGTLSSAAFEVSHPWASFLVAGGAWPDTRVELVQADSQEVFFKVSGHESETLEPVVVDLKAELGKSILIRLVDERKGPWGHVNFDNFVFYDQQPHFSVTPEIKKPDADLPPMDVVKHAGVVPSDAVGAMTLPEGFHATVFAAEPDVVQPIAFTIDQRGRLWVVEGLTYPLRAPEGKGRDRIVIFEDTKGTGHFDKRTVFIEGLNLASGIEVGFGGVWVGAAPYFLFIPVASWDDPKPASPPQILLDGFAHNDSHETLNTFSWGPDGWLYGCHGVFNASYVGKPGTPRSQRVHIDAGIWRYHPIKHIFERFSEGTSNPWGLDYDAHGQIIIEACVIPHLWHMIQGGHYQRQAGGHDNPYVFDDIKTIADHLHWGGGPNPWAVNGRSDAFGGGHAHAGLLVYQGASWPSKYDGSYFMNNIHGSRINMDVPQVEGSGFVGHHGKDFILFNDTWSRVVNIRADQDGSAYMIDWYDAQHCHTNNPNDIDRSNGRIYKIVYGDTKTTPVNLDKLSDKELVSMQNGEGKERPRENVWYSRTARRLLEERAAAGKLSPETRSSLETIVSTDQRDSHRQNALWALHVTGGVPENLWKQVLNSDHPYDVAWVIQFLCQEENPPAEAVTEFRRLAKDSKSPVVRLYLASACQRMPLEQTWDIVAGLLGHSEDAADHNLPLMDWYALEPLAAKDPQGALHLAMQTKLPNLLSFTIRRIGAIGTDGAIAAMAGSLNQAPDEQRQLEILGGISDALRGRRNVTMPEGWEPIEQKLMAGPSDAVREKVAALSVTFGSAKALEFERKTLADTSAGPGSRQAALEALLSVRDPGLATTLQGLLSDPQLRGRALRGLAEYDDASTPGAIIGSYASLDPAEKKDALSTLASRPAFAKPLLDAVGAGKIPAHDVSADIVRLLRNLHEPSIDQEVTKVWGVLRDSPSDKLARMAELRKIVERSGSPPNLPHGRQLFTQTCSQCHTLYGSGGHVGPDITGSNRADLTYLLQHVVDPNAAIPNDYRPTIIKTKDDRVIIGIVKKQDAHALTVQTPNELTTIPLDEIARQKISELGMMPEGLFDNFKPNDVRDLIAYLRGSQQVSLADSNDSQAPGAAGPGTSAAQTKDLPDGVLFNGKDLTGWWSDRINLWSVENGELVGKTDTGIRTNEFLKSKKSYGDFHLVVKMKLVPNEANSGIQFHSEVFEGNEMAGPQADAGKGWWGKLYGENFGNKVIGDNKSGEQVVKPNEWNRYEVLAVGSKVRTAINGHLCVDVDDPKYVRTGMFGLQIHAGGPTEVRFKDFEFQEKPKFEMKTVKSR